MIALITDFGLTDLYVGVVKGVIKSINPRADIVDVTHGVKSFSITDAQFTLHSSIAYFPSGTIFAIVVDPGVGTDRKGLIAVSKTHAYVLPDNGIISAVKQEGMRYYHIYETSYPEASATFHGRDVFAPVAAWLSLGQKPEKLGTRVRDIVMRPFPEYSVDKHGCSGVVLHIDKFGNATTSIPNGAIDSISGPICSVVSDRYSFNAAYARTYGDIGSGQCGMIRGSTGFMELAANQKSIAETFGIAVGDQIVINNTI
jgi:S-adenosylmethionine hydrolase